MHFVCRKTRRFWREISKTQMRNVMSTDISQSLQDILRVTQRRFLSKRQDAGLALFAIRSGQIRLIISRIDKTNELLLGNYTQTKEHFNTFINGRQINRFPKRSRQVSRYRNYRLKYHKRDTEPVSPCWRVSRRKFKQIQV